MEWEGLDGLLAFDRLLVCDGAVSCDAGRAADLLMAMTARRLAGRGRRERLEHGAAETGAVDHAAACTALRRVAEAEGSATGCPPATTTDHQPTHRHSLLCSLSFSLSHQPVALPSASATRRSAVQAATWSIAPVSAAPCSSLSRLPLLASCRAVIAISKSAALLVSQDAVPSQTSSLSKTNSPSNVSVLSTVLRHGDYTRYWRYCTAWLRFLHVLLYSSERAWSHAMEKRQLPHGPNARQRIYLIGRL
ncbi:hypothetical protein PIB30_018004 [Stylosanthes scabra]|uniref:Signal recognition particle subunit SRP68 n=1 Tax=Stylosanthes scabra TaxID=79078 RepID=A0ABU6V6T1_9FABA|nr:hypothetical protein [Stylosanthes scabra]